MNLKEKLRQVLNRPGNKGLDDFLESEGILFERVDHKYYTSKKDISIHHYCTVWRCSKGDEVVFVQFNNGCTGFDGGVYHYWYFVDMDDRFKEKASH